MKIMRVKDLSSRLSASILLLLLVGSATVTIAQEATVFPLPSFWLKADKGKIISTTTKQDSSQTKELQGLTLDKTLNFNQVLDFKEITPVDLAYSLEGLSGLCAIAVYQPADTTERGLWSTQQGLSRNILTTTQSVLGPDSIIDTYHIPHTLPVINTVQQNWTETQAINPQAYMLLGAVSEGQDVKPFKGTIAEFMVFDRVLSFLERLQVETYLAIKYGIPLTIGNYVSANQQVLWHQEENKGYAHRIAGIGRQDAYQLYQKQTLSAHDTAVQLTLSYTPGSGSATASRMQDNHFLVWGDNDMPLTDQPAQGTGEDDTILLVVQRKWLMDVTGAQASRMSTQLQVNIHAFPKDSPGYWLVIDRSGRGDFSIDNLEYIVADSVTDSTAIYKNIHWDTDQSGSDVFGFARAKYMMALIRPIADVLCSDPTQGSASISVMGGRGPYQYALTKESEKFSRSWQDADSTIQEALSAGSYNLIIKDADQYEISRKFSVKMIDALAVDLGPDQQLQQGQQISLDASAYIPDSTEVTYAWESNYGYNSIGSKATITASGIYTVTVTNQAGCQFKDEIIISGSEQQKFAVLPNQVHPAERFTVNVSLPEAGPVEVKVFNASGNLYQQIKADHQAEYQFILQINHTGLYMISLQTKNGVAVQKVLIY